MKSRIASIVVSSIALLCGLASQAHLIIDAPPKPPVILDNNSSGRPPHYTAVVFIDTQAIEDQQKYLKMDSPQEWPEAEHYSHLLYQIGERLKSDGLLKAFAGKNPRSSVWWLDEKYRDLRVGYFRDHEGQIGLVVGFPIGMDFFDKGFRLDMLQDDSYKIFIRILTEFRGLFVNTHNPKLRGTVSFGDSTQFYNFRFTNSFSGLKVELFTDNNSPAKSFLKVYSPNRFCSSLFAN